MTLKIHVREASGSPLQMYCLESLHPPISMINLFTKYYLTTPDDELDITDVEAIIQDNPLKDQIFKLDSYQ